MVVEDHHVVRAGLVALLSMVEDFEIVAEAGDGLQAVDQFRLQRPDVTVIDLRLPEFSGAEVITCLRRESKQARFIVLTAYVGEEDVYRAVQAGAQAYLLKGSTGDELVETIRLVYEGRSHLPVEVGAALARRLSSKKLTKRETAVLEKVVQGLSNKEIGSVLNISEATVKSFVNDLMKKMGASDRTHAVTLAIQRGMVALDSTRASIRQRITLNTKRL